MLPLRFAQGFGSRAQHDNAVLFCRALVCGRPGLLTRHTGTLDIIMRTRNQVINGEDIVKVPASPPSPFPSKMERGKGGEASGLGEPTA